MSTNASTTDSQTQIAHSDSAAVFKHAFLGVPLTSEISKRVDERAARITERVRQTYGVIDDRAFQLLLADDES